MNGRCHPQKCGQGWQRPLKIRQTSEPILYRMPCVNTVFPNEVSRTKYVRNTPCIDLGHSGSMAQTV